MIKVEKKGEPHAGIYGNDLVYQAYVDLVDEIKHIPKGIELILTNVGTIKIYPAGTMARHLGSKDDSFGIGSTNLEVAKTFITSIKCSKNLIPYSEGN